MAKKEAGGVVNDDTVVDVVSADRMRVGSPARDVVTSIWRDVHRGHRGREPRAEALGSVKQTMHARSARISGSLVMYSRSGRAVK